MPSTTSSESYTRMPLSPAALSTKDIQSCRFCNSFLALVDMLANEIKVKGLARSLRRQSEVAVLGSIGATR